RVRRIRTRFAGRLENLAKAMQPAPSLSDLQQGVGGAWDEIGQLQFDYLVSQGLKPDDAFLDLGCGVLRGGRHFISYLEAGNYYGIDANPDMIRVGDEVVAQSGSTSKQPTLRVTETFDIDFGRQFDKGLALSVFTHLPINSIYRALVNIGDQFRGGGFFY